MRANNITLTNSTVSSNSAGNSGGGLYANGNITLTNSTVSGNSAGNNGPGGGLWANGNITLTNSTVSGNSAGGDGGGLYADGGTTTLTNSTVSGNSSNNRGGGLYAGNITLTNSIVANNTDNGTAPDLKAFGTITATNSLIEDSTGATITGSNNIIGVDPQLGPLANNGGPTQTHALLAGSPAIDAGNNGLVPGIRNSGDQRGFIPGIFNGTVDIGAYEFGAVDPNPPVAAVAAVAAATTAAAANSTTIDADLFDSQEETENLTDEFLKSNSCQTIPEIELEKDDEEDGEQIEEDLNATDGIDLDEDCLPMNDNDGDGAQFLPFSSF
ncbi:choice-of-anchor Q domain-containing protein [Spirulina major]|uniref:choice-of-anchor Q domain-containing protein n=1 Tax=Spirulina major TaxID=270636 RepID=UPI0009354773|nr:choice-of-anchor Q domain-containing protein [Spirulina major]